MFTVYDNGYPHNAFLFGGVGRNFEGVELAPAYVDSVRRIQQISDIEVNIPNHPDQGELFERHEMLQQRQDGDPHPFVDPESWRANLDMLLTLGLEKLDQEQAVTGQ